MSKRAQVFLCYWLPPCALAAALFVQSSFRMPVQPPQGLHFSDKFLHAVVYGVLAWLLLRAFHRAQGLPLARAAWWAFLATALYGITDEVHQGLVPSRSMDAADWVADVIGAATVFLALPGARLIRHLRGTSGAG